MPRVTLSKNPVGSSRWDWRDPAIRPSIVKAADVVSLARTSPFPPFLSFMHRRSPELKCLDFGSTFDLSHDKPRLLYQP